jgi:hypothetical protein
MATTRTKKTSKEQAPTLRDYVEAFCDAPLTRKAVMDLSSLLAKVVGGMLQEQLPGVAVEVGHRAFGGAVRRHHLDAFVANEHLGLQLGIDVKGLNSPSSVGKNWNNRVGDLHELATNHHQSFPKAVMGGVLAIPYEGLGESILRNIEKAMLNMGGRRGTVNAHNLFEQASLIVISKERRLVLPNIPQKGGPLRIETFASGIADIFKQRWQ